MKHRSPEETVVSTLFHPKEIPTPVTVRVHEVLAELERDQGVRVLHTVESGSRAWGFPSPDSDYDVRFLYVHERNWYLSLEEARDVIERPPEKAGLDLGGWDLRKALRLFNKSNPPLYEWLTSPIVYSRFGTLTEDMRALAERHYSRRTMGRHYLNIAKSQHRTYLGNRETVPLKRYFYVIRPLCSLLWLREREDLPPMSLPELMAGVPLPVAMCEATDELLAKKSVTSEMGKGVRIAAIDSWAAAVIAEAEELCNCLAAKKSAVREIDDFYRSALSAYAL